MINSETESQLPIILHRLTCKDPLRSSSKGSSTKRGKRDGAVTDDRVGHLGLRISGDNGSIQRSNANVKTVVMFVLSFFQQCEGARTSCVPKLKGSSAKKKVAISCVRRRGA